MTYHDALNAVNKTFKNAGNAFTTHKYSDASKLYAEVITEYAALVITYETEAKSNGVIAPHILANMQNAYANLSSSLVQEKKFDDAINALVEAKTKNGITSAKVGGNDEQFDARIKQIWNLKGEDLLATGTEAALQEILKATEITDTTIMLNACIKLLKISTANHPDRIAALEKAVAIAGLDAAVKNSLDLVLTKEYLLTGDPKATGRLTNADAVKALHNDALVLCNTSATERDGVMMLFGLRTVDATCNSALCTIASNHGHNDLHDGIMGVAGHAFPDIDQILA